jgi:elongation factor G
MKEYTLLLSATWRCIAHGAGKTMLAEACLHFSGATTRLGKIEDGTTAADFEDEEIRRGISLSTAILPVEYKDHRINLLDTPGTPISSGEISACGWRTERSWSRPSRSEVGTEIAWNYCDQFNLPRIVVINK